jgi:hypothetical protein
MEEEPKSNMDQVIDDTWVKLVEHVVPIIETKQHAVVIAKAYNQFNL